MTLSRRDFLAAGGAALAASGMKASPPPAGDLLAGRDALGLAELVRRREVSALELLEAAIARAEAVNPKFNFLAQKHYDYARRAIANGLPDGPFTGVPFLLKDLNTYIEGEVTGQGSRYYANNRATVTSEIVRRQQRAGLVIFGKTTTPELGLNATTESAATGKTRNPWNPDRTTGGSSGGAAAAVAAGVVPAAHATDGGGSIRIPASCCGLFGLKPSRGRTPMGPLRTEGWGGLSIAHAVTRSVRDSAALLDATHGIEPGSRYAAPTPERSFLKEAGRSPGALRIAFSAKAPDGSAIDPDCAAAVEAAARLCETLGHHVEEAAPVLDRAALAGGAAAIMASSVAAELLARQEATGVAPTLEVLDPMTFLVFQQGLAAKGLDLVRAQNAIQTAAIKIAEFMADYDILLEPVLGSPPVALGALDISIEDPAPFVRTIQQFAPFTGVYNQTGQPSMSVPLAMSKDGLPVGVMFTGRYGAEGALFRLAGQLEVAAPWADRRPPAA